LFYLAFLNRLYGNFNRFGPGGIPDKHHNQCNQTNGDKQFLAVPDHGAVPCYGRDSTEILNVYRRFDRTCSGGRGGRISYLLIFRPDSEPFVPLGIKHLYFGYLTE
jgi:hypothetical protein